jgi:ribonuclease VapC
MILDTSAVIAILKEEPEALRFAEAIEDAASVSISAATLLEANIVAGALQNPKIRARLEDMLAEADVDY